MIPRRLGILGIVLVAACFAQAAPDDFAIVAIPDIHADQKLPQWNASCQWIIDNQVLWNIRAVIGLGDYITNAPVDAQWTAVMPNWKFLRQAGLPVLFAPGNHDSGFTSTWAHWNVNIADRDWGWTRYWPASYTNIDKDPKAAQQCLALDVPTSRGTCRLGLVTLNHFATKQQVAKALEWMEDAGRQYIVGIHMFTSFVPAGVAGQHPCIAGEDTDDDCVPVAERNEQDGAAIWEQLKDTERLVAILDGHKHVLKSSVMPGTHKNTVVGVSGATCDLVILKFRPAAKKLQVWMLQTAFVPPRWNPAWGKGAGYVEYDWAPLLAATRNSNAN